MIFFLWDGLAERIGPHGILNISVIAQTVSAEGCLRATHPS